jgi:hypothetical protein
VDSGALFGLSVLMGFGAFGIVTKIYLLPSLRAMRRDHALTALLIPNIFRFIGLCFLVPGVVAASLPRAFAAPVAYGDLVAAILAVIATLALYGGRSWAIPVVWVFNVWGALDLLLGFYQGEIGVRIEPGSLGAAYFIPTVFVPALLIIHGLTFWLLLRKSQKAQSPSADSWLS